METEKQQTQAKPSVGTRAGRFAAGFGEGMRTPGKGFMFLVRHPLLWPYAVLPILISLAVTVVVLACAFFVGTQLLSWMHTLPHFASGWWGRTQEFFADLLVIAAMLGGAVAGYILLGGILSAYYNERLAKRAEILLGATAEELHEAPFKEQVVDGLRGFAAVVVTTLLCFLMGCVPLVGSLVGGAISIYVDCRVFGFEYFEIPMSLRRVPRREKKAYARRHRPQVLGLGATVLLMQLIPLVGSVFLASAAVGSVLLHRKIEERERGISVVGVEVVNRPALG